MVSINDNSCKKGRRSISSGDVFYVAARHDDVILIEKEKDDNNPYFVSVDWLMKVSSFKDNN